MQTKIRDLIVFERGGMESTGIVIRKYEQSTVVEVVTVIGGELS
ncbi:hypothetical protein [Bacillus toyonensis]|nr:hypothetical protein [Bacillus toyonensis]